MNLVVVTLASNLSFPSNRSGSASGSQRVDWTRLCEPGLRAKPRNLGLRDPEDPASIINARRMDVAVSVHKSQSRRCFWLMVMLMVV